MAKILVVDDAAFMRRRCSKLLAENGHQVIEAGTGREAVDQYRASAPDAVLLDITMPDMDGLSALREIKAHDSDCSVAIVTAMGQQSVVMEALRLGAKDFVVKPFDAGRILSAVQKLVA